MTDKATDRLTSTEGLWRLQIAVNGLLAAPVLETAAGEYGARVAGDLEYAGKVLDEVAPALEAHPKILQAARQYLVRCGGPDVEEAAGCLRTVYRELEELTGTRLPLSDDDR